MSQASDYLNEGVRPREVWAWACYDFATRPGDWEARRACFTNLDEQWIEDADHMLHHDQPAEVARIIEAAFPQGSAN